MKLKKMQFEHKGKNIDLTFEEAQELYLELKKHFGKEDEYPFPSLPINPIPIGPLPYAPGIEPYVFPWETTFYNKPIHTTTSGDAILDGGGPSTCLKN